MATPTPTPTPTVAPMAITVSGNRILRDGVAWVPHAVQLTAFVAPPSAQKPPFIAAYRAYNVDELKAIKLWGADSVRMQLSEPGADADNNDPVYDPTFVANFVSAVKAARAVGLNVIVSIQDEQQSGETSPSDLPDPKTNNVWRHLAPVFMNDPGVVYELFNEPQPTASAANWINWAAAMNATIQTIRATGATNALVADGLSTGETLDGVIPLTDPLNKVIYSSHPYFHYAVDQQQATWARKFGNAAATLPVIVGEWAPATTYYCAADTNTAALALLQYIQANNIGLVAVSYDFGLPYYGGIVSDYKGTPTTYAGGRQCHSDGSVDYGYGFGTLVQQWYLTGAVPQNLE